MTKLEQSLDISVYLYVSTCLNYHVTQHEDSYGHVGPQGFIDRSRKSRYDASGCLAQRDRTVLFFRVQATPRA